MPIKIGDTVPKECDDIKQGVHLVLFDTPQPLAGNSGTLVYVPPSAGRKADIIAYERSKFIDICEKDDFAKAYTPLAMKIRLLGKCPWYEHEGVKFRVRSRYSESTNPVNGVSSALLSQIETWNRDSSFTDSFSTASIGDPFSRGSSGVGSFFLKLEQIDPDPSSPAVSTNIKITAVLSSFGKPYTILSGTPVTQIRTMPCHPWATRSGFWTGIHFSGGPIGLVMSLSWEVAGNFGFV